MTESLVSWFLKESLHNWVVFHPPKNPKQPRFFPVRWERGPANRRRWYAGTLLSPPGAGTLVRCFPRLALVRWHAATLNGRRGAGTLNCAGTLLR